MQKILLSICAGLLLTFTLAAQTVMVSGTVLDSTRKLIVPSVKVTSTSGAITYTDSVGHYNILVNPTDSIAFFYRNKSTTWFPVADMRYTKTFDIALQIRLESRYQTLQEIVVIGKSYRQDSIENREKYKRIFNGSTGGLKLTETTTYGGTPGLDPNEIINMFRFRRNRSLKAFQKRLLDEEAEKFVSNRFNKPLVKRISGFQGAILDSFMEQWRPDYDFTVTATEYQFHEYILEASKLYRKGIVPNREMQEQK
jgi:hypothetical protein